MDSQDNSQDCHGGDSDDEIAELRFQALLTKRENEAEVSPAHEPRPMMDNLAKNSINQPLSNYRSFPNSYQHYSSRGRGFQNQPYLQTFSQQMASSSVNSSNIVVLTSSNDTYPEQPKGDWNRERERGRGRGASGRWPRGGGNFHIGLPPPVSSISSSQAPVPQLVLPQDKYAAQPKISTETSEANKTKLSARMRRLQGSDSDSEDSDSDSSGDSTSESSSSDSNSSSSDSSSSGTDSDSDDSTALTSKKAAEKTLKKDKVAKPEVCNSLPPLNNKSNLESQVKPTSLVSANAEGMTKVPPSNFEFSSKKSSSTLNSPPLHQSVSPIGKSFSRSSPVRRSLSKDRKFSSPPRYRIRSRSPRYRSPSPGLQRYRKNSSPSYPARAFSPKKYLPSRSRSPLGRYSRSPKYKRLQSKSPIRVVHSPLRRLSSKSPVSNIRKYSPLSPSIRYKSRSKSPILRPRYISRSPVHHRSSLSPKKICRRSRSPYVVRKKRLSSKSPIRYRSRSPVRPLKRFSPPKSPLPNKRFTSISPPPFRRISRSPPVHRVLSPLSRRRSSRSLSPRRYSPNRPRSPFYKSKERSPLSPRRRKSPISPRVKRFMSRSPKNSLPRSQMSPLPPPKRMQSPSPVRRLKSPQAIRRVGSPLSPKSHPTVSKISYGSPGRKRHSPPFRKIYRPSSRSPSRSRLSPRRPFSPLKRISPIKSSHFIRSRSRPLSPRDLRHHSRSPPYMGKRLSPTQRVSPLLKENKANLIPLADISTYYRPESDNFQGGHIPRDKLDSYADYNSLQKRLPSPINRTNSNNPPQKRYVTPDNSAGQWNRSRLSPPSPHFLQKHPHSQVTGPPHGHENNWPPGPTGQQDRNYNLPPRGSHFQTNRSLERNYDNAYQGPPNQMERNFDLPNRGPPPRLDRFVDSGNGHSSHQLPARGRGNRGLNRGFLPRGSNQSRLSSKAPWLPLETPQIFEPGLNQDKHFKESLSRGPPTLKNVDRFSERSVVSEKFAPHKSLSPPIKRKGPQTPPDPPKRDPSPLEYQKHLPHDRTPSLSPSPSRKDEHFSKLDQETDLVRRDNIKSDKSRNSPHKMLREKEKSNVARKERENVDLRRGMTKKSSSIPDDKQVRNLKEPIDGTHLKHSSNERKQDIKYKEHVASNVDEVISRESQHRVSRYPRLNDGPKESIRNKSYSGGERFSDEKLRDADKLNTERSKPNVKMDHDYSEKSNVDFPKTFDRANRGEYDRDSSRSFKSTRPIRREPSNETTGHSSQVSSKELEKNNHGGKHDHTKIRVVSNTNVRTAHSRDRHETNNEERKHDSEKAKKEAEVKRKKEELKPLKIEKVKHIPKMLEDVKEISNKKVIGKEEAMSKILKVKKPELENTVEVKEEKKLKPRKLERKKLKDGEDKKKKKKKLKEEDKKAKKKRKEKKKKKEAKKHRKINKTSESEEEETPKKKKEKVCVKAMEEDLRHTLTRGDRVDLEKDRVPKRKREYSTERYEEKRRREEEASWPVLNRGKREVEEYYRTEDRYRDEFKTRRVDRERDRSSTRGSSTRDDNGLLVTVGSNIDRQVVPKGSRTQKHMQSGNKGSNVQLESREREASRVPVKLRLSRPIDADRAPENVDRNAHDHMRVREDSRAKGNPNRQRRGGGKNMERRRQNNR